MRGRDPGSFLTFMTDEKVPLARSITLMEYIFVTFCRFGFTTIKESFKTFAREQKSIKQIAKIFLFTEKLVICKSQIKDEQDGLCWPKRGRFSGQDGGWAVEEVLLLGSSRVSFLSFFSSQNCIWRREKQTMSSVYSTFKLLGRGNNDLEASLSFFILICIWLRECQKQLKAHEPSARHLRLQKLDQTNSCRLLHTQERCN